jgi:hypothetical protein
MKTKLVTSFALAAGLLMVCSPMFAHHGSAVSYVIDLKKQVTVTGTVTEWRWANPHCYLMYDVKDEKGNIVNWGAETGAPNTMAGHGFTRNTFKPGDTVTITVFPSRIGSARGLLSKVVLNGKVLLDDAQSRVRTPPADGEVSPEK